uniref:Uncharacterized protein n=1 Tax=Nothoprocta perdicaria TaxID=30464 RepID=A0A8C7EDR1_NOTPE
MNLLRNEMFHLFCGLRFSTPAFPVSPPSARHRGLQGHRVFVSAGMLCGSPRSVPGPKTSPEATRPFEALPRVLRGTREPRQVQSLAAPTAPLLDPPREALMVFVKTSCKEILHPRKDFILYIIYFFLAACALLFLCDVPLGVGSR